MADGNFVLRMDTFRSVSERAIGGSTIVLHETSWFMYEQDAR